MTTASAAQAQTNHVSSTLGTFADAGQSLTAVEKGSSSVGDFDGDGDLDLLITGRDDSNNKTATIYTNDGDGTFSDAGNADDDLTGVELSSSSVGDFDGDGDLDLLLTGRDNSNNEIARVYTNDGNGTFSDAGSADDALTGVEIGSSSVGDFDGDGNLDLLLTGRDNSNNEIARVYTNNDGNGTFSKDSSSQDLTGVSQSSSSVGDFDGDDDLDLLITGDKTGYGKLTTAIYTNDSDGGFSKSNLKGFYQSSSSVGDFNGDGDLDLLVTGDISNSAATATIYINDGNGSFTEDTSQSLGGVHYSSSSVGDFDGDGDLDLLITGIASNADPTATIYTNDGNGSFTEDTSQSLMEVGRGSNSVGDFDGDGDPDLLITGLESDNKETATIYENTSTTTLTIEGTAGTGNDAGWRMLGAPGAITRGDLNDDFTFDFGTVSSGAVAYVWDASTQQWSPLQSDTDVIAAGQGVALYFFDDADDTIGSGGIDLQMPSTRSAQSDVTRTGLDTGQFVFVANPYLQEFDLSSLDIESSDFSQAVQVFDPDQGSFVTKDRFSSETVAALQGFFVERLNPGSGPTSLTFSKSGVQNGPGSFIGTKSEAPTLASAGVELRLVVESEGDTLAQNRATVLFHEGAAAGWDAYDATQLTPPGTSAYATLTSPIERSDGTLALRTQAAEPFPEGTPAEVPLSARSVGTDGGIGGTAHIALVGAPDASGPIELIDTETGATVDLRAEDYSFSLAAGDGAIANLSEARFTLRAGAGALPVALTRLTATPDAGGVLLEWTTASEEQNAGFEIERQAVGEESAASDDWTTVGFVEGAGTTTEAQAYRFRAEGLPVGTHRFRLRQLDADGTATLSNPVTASVRLAETHRITAPSPNPATSGATMRLAVQETQPVRVAVYDVLGREVTVLHRGPLPAQQSTTLRVGEGLPAGQYFVRAVGERFRTTERLTIVR